ncbi:hypothetical protein [Sphingomonas sp.]|uniref:hypothetical protein n=1 Tax=Sphingomonas sp. TaxID=28214 RepID=UPI0038B407CF
MTGDYSAADSRVALKAFDIVYPPADSPNTSVEILVKRLFDLAGERWVDLCVLRKESASE